MDRARMSATITGKTCPLKKNPKEIRPETIWLKAGRKSSVSNKDKKNPKKNKGKRNSTVCILQMKCVV
jgi:hypothetical protein